MMKTEQTFPGRLCKGSMRDLLYVLFGHKGKVTVFMLLLFGAVAIKTLLQTGMYRSEARLLVRLGRETVSLDPTATIGELASVNRSHDTEIKSELEILRSRDIAERVADELGVEVFRQGFVRAASTDPTAMVPSADGILPAVKSVLSVVKSGPARLAVRLGLLAPVSERERVIHRIAESMEIKALENTSVISLACEEQSPGLARDVLDKFIQAYLEKHLSVYHIANSREFFEQQVSELSSKLGQAEKELQEVKDATGISSLQEQQSVVVNTIGMLERNLAETEAQLAAANAKIAGIQEILAALPETVVVEETTGFSDYGADLMRSKLYELRLAEKNLEARYTHESRQMEMIRDQIDEGMSLLEEEQSRRTRTEVKKGVNSTYQQMQTALLTEQSNASALQSRLDKMRAQVIEARDVLRGLNGTEVRTSRLQREIALLTGSYNRYSEKLEEARIDEALKSERISSINVLQAATLPVVPLGLQKIPRLALGLLFAIVGGLGFAFLCEYLDHSVKTPEDVQENLQLATLASIPRTRLNTVCPASRPNRWRRLGIGHEGTFSAQWDIPVAVRRHYAMLRERLLLDANGSVHGHYVIGVTSCSSSEGVSTVAANLASSLSELSSGPVLLVDANTHRPSVHRIFRAKLSPGLVDVLATEDPDDRDDPIIRRTEDLSILTAGSTNGFSAKIVTADNFSRFLHSARQDYRFVVVDMPAMEEDGSLVRLAGACDGVVLVVEAQRLRWEVVLKAKQQLQQWNINVLGVLLNKRRFPVPDWVYSAL